MPEGIQSFHNSLLQLIIVNGIIAASLLIWILYFALYKYGIRFDKYCIKKPAYQSVIFILIISLFHGTFLDFQVNIIFWLGMGLIYRDYVMCRFNLT